MLEIKEVTKKYGTTTALREVNLSIPRGEIVGLFGENGAGKTTLMKSILGFHPYQGEILLDGEDITNKTITERANLGISFAFQQPVRFKGITVLELMRIASKKQLTIAEACDYLSEVGLCAKDYVNREVNASLSGGELKRIEIATVLARGTKLSIFDEPEAGIDLWSFQNLIRVFEHMRSTIKGSIIIISHQERILDIADEVIVLAGGTVSKKGSKETILPELLCSAGGVTKECNRSKGVEEK